MNWRRAGWVLQKVERLGSGAWYRAGGQGECSALGSLFHAGILIRRAVPGGRGFAKYEYQIPVDRFAREV